jgi:predicted ABC-type ATPase
MATLIVVSGPNGAGKTTLINNCRKELQQMGYSIIIPDDIVSASDTPISDAVSASISNNSHTVFETPLQYDELAEQVQKFMQAGYHTILLQLFLENSESSALRVKQRAAKGGRNIISAEVGTNFKGNYDMLIKYQHLFHQSYFIEASNNKNPVAAELLAAQFIFYYPLQSVYIRDLLYEIVVRGKKNKQSLTILKNNKLYGELSYKKMDKALRVIFRLKK